MTTKALRSTGRRLLQEPVVAAGRVQRAAVGGDGRGAGGDGGDGAGAQGVHVQEVLDEGR